MGYLIHDGRHIDYDLNIVDTPGFGDTRGIAKDKEIVDQIREFFTTKGKQGIMFLNAVCFIVQAPLARLTPTKKYFFDAVLSLFVRDVSINIYVLITFADSNSTPVIDALKGANVPFKKWYPFNSSALLSSSENPQHSEFDQLFWKMGEKGFHAFFDDLRSAETKSLQLTKEVLILRQNLEAAV